MQKILKIAVAGDGGGADRTLRGAHGAPLRRLPWPSHRTRIKVDGKHAVGYGASLSARKGKLVATSTANGRVPDSQKLQGTDAGRSS